MPKKLLLIILLYCPLVVKAQINVERVTTIGRNALYYEDYVLSIQYFNQAIAARPWHYEAYFFRGLAKYYLDDFRGGELDCSKAIERNPFFINAYHVRALCRINQENYTQAVEDYRVALQHDPHEQGLWQNLVLCLAQEGKYDSAKVELEQVFTRWPKYAKAHLLLGQILLAQKDTIGAVSALDKSIKLDEFDSDVWSFSAVIDLQREMYAEAEQKLNRAIGLQSQQASLYINRALARYHTDNWTGAMDDYNLALEIEPTSYLGHFNRALLRAQVGEDNLAIEDFNFVLEREPDNMIALFNRAILLDNVGEYQSAIKDLSRVIEEYPDFIMGYQYRARIRRKIGDRKNAEWDEFYVLKAQLESRTNSSPRNNSDKRTRKQGDREIENYDKLVVADREDIKTTYANKYRGRVQDNKVHQTPKPMSVLSYYEQVASVRKSTPYHRIIDELNATKVLSQRISLITEERQLDSILIRRHFDSIGSETARIEEGEESDLRYFARAMDNYLVQDFENANTDFSKAITLNNQFALAYFMRAVVKKKQLDAQQYMSHELTTNETQNLRETNTRITHHDIILDLEKVLTLVPDFAFGYYNRGCIYSATGERNLAIADYSRAIELDSTLAEAYYNRGLLTLHDENNAQAIADLSKAGELGLYSAYSFLKQYNTRNNATNSRR